MEKEGGVDEREDEAAEEEEMRGEEPGVVEAPGSQKQEMKPDAGGGKPRRIGREEAGGRMRNIGDPRLPSQKEVEDHYLTMYRTAIGVHIASADEARILIIVRGWTRTVA